MHYFYFICELKFYTRTHVKITRQWKSALRQISLINTNVSLRFADHIFGINRAIYYY